MLFCSLVLNPKQSISFYVYSLIGLNHLKLPSLMGGTPPAPACLCRVLSPAWPPQRPPPSCRFRTCYPTPCSKPPGIFALRFSWKTSHQPLIFATSRQGVRILMEPSGKIKLRHNNLCYELSRGYGSCGLHVLEIPPTLLKNPLLPNETMLFLTILWANDAKKCTH